MGTRKLLGYVMVGLFILGLLGLLGITGTAPGEHKDLETIGIGFLACGAMMMIPLYFREHWDSPLPKFIDDD